MEQNYFRLVELKLAAEVLHVYDTVLGVGNWEVRLDVWDYSEGCFIREDMYVKWKQNTVEC